MPTSPMEDEGMRNAPDSEVRRYGNPVLGAFRGERVRQRRYCPT